MENNSDSRGADFGFGLVDGQRMADEKTKDMNEQKKVMVLTCGSEEIIIEANDMNSDDSEFTDTSSCSSDSDYEEIEVNVPTNANKRLSDNTFLNPYVRLVRCDHLVTKMSSKADTSVNDTSPLRKSNEFRYSPRRRRPNCNYNSDDFLLFDYTLISQKGLCQRKKKVSKHEGKARPRSDKGCFTRKSPTHLEGSTFSGDNDNLNIPTFNFNVSNAILNPSPALSENIKLEFLNEEGFHNDTYDSVSSVCSSSFRKSNETSTQPLINTIIKSEPIDEYFEGTTDNYFNHSSSTVGNEYSFYRVKNEGIANTFIYTETDCTEELPDENVGVNIKSMYKQEMIDTESCVRKMKTENNVESSDSEVDVENDWDGPVFILDSEIVAFDHPYAFSCDTFPSNNISRNRDLANPHAKKTHSVSTVLPGTKKHSASTVLHGTKRHSAQTVLHGAKRHSASTVLHGTKRHSASTVLHGAKRHSASTVLHGTKRHSASTALYGTKTHSSITFLHGTVTGQTVKSSQTLSPEESADKSPLNGRNVKCSQFSFSRKSSSSTSGPGSVEKEEALRYHNTKERFRRKCMADSFKDLRDLIPKLEGNDRASKKEILSSSVKYIRQLEQTESIFKTTLRVLNEKHAGLKKNRDHAVANI